MVRILIAPRGVRQGEIVLTEPDTVHHLVRVLQVKGGEMIECLDGRGRRYRTRFVVRQQRVVRLAIEDERYEAPFPIRLELMQALIEPARFDWIVQKATELGVARLIPMMAARTTARLQAGAAPAKVARWCRIAETALVQCGRA